jgi:hypothetical protein
VKDIESAAKSQIEPEPDRVWSVLQFQLGHIQAELIGAYIKIAKIVRFRSRVIEVERIVNVDQAAKVNWSH